MKRLSILFSLLMGLAMSQPVWSYKEADLQRLLNTGSCVMCDLRRANLAGANLAGAMLFEANLEGANLEGANLRGAYVIHADLSNLSNANLMGATLSGGREANLSGANLTKATLRGDLSGANLRGANLTHADLSNTDLTGADLSGAILSGADLNGTILTSVKGLTQEMLDVTKIPWDRLNLMVEIEREPCLGTCPIYSLYINSDGSSLYSGYAHTNVVGERKFMLTKEQLLAIRTVFQRQRFFSIPRNCCNCYDVTDNPSITIFYKAKYKSAFIHHYKGCLSSGDWGHKMDELERRVLEITKISDWIG